MEDSTNLENYSKKKEILKEYKSTIISAISLILDNLNIEKQMADSKIKKIEYKDIEKSIDRYSKLKIKINNDEDLTDADYSLLSVTCLSASNLMISNSKILLDSAEKIRDLAKFFVIK